MPELVGQLSGKHGRQARAGLAADPTAIGGKIEVPGAGIGRHPNLLSGAVTVDDEAYAVGELERQNVAGEFHFERFAQTLTQFVELSQ